MANLEKKFEGHSKKQLNVVIDGIPMKLSFEQIEVLVLKRSKPTRYNMGNKVGGFSISNSIESFACHFTKMFYPDYEERTFKVNIQFSGVSFWEIPTLTKTDILNLTAPDNCLSGTLQTI